MSASCRHHELILGRWTIGCVECGAIWERGGADEPVGTFARFDPRAPSEVVVEQRAREVQKKIAIKIVTPKKRGPYKTKAKKLPPFVRGKGTKEQNEKREKARIQWHVREAARRRKLGLPLSKMTRETLAKAKPIKLKKPLMNGHAKPRNITPEGRARMIEGARIARMRKAEKRAAAANE